MTTLRNDDKKIFEMLEETKKQFDQFAQTSEMYRLSSLLRKNEIVYHNYSWDSPLDLVWNEGEDNAILE